ncbi:hypothetical protein H2200_011883 [Cladophialophora chaetospira]|uniref:BTB domain-containing protein n=1 Tax=Cladophialophora chaetospira TaxID=386627 RepID=A0AA39CD08_9EURO|nr:hypothetical protein H2200_011883 [Cladophialophora chaetospira]
MEPNVCPASQTTSEDGHTETQVKLIIGSLPEQRTLTISKSLLIDTGGFFAACFHYGMQESQTNEIKFPEEPIAPFERLIGLIRMRAPADRYTQCDKETILQCLEVYLLADKYCLSKTQDAIADGLNGRWYHKMEKEHFFWTLDNMEPKTPLYRLAIDRMALAIAKRPTDYLAQNHPNSGGYQFSTQGYIKQVEIVFGQEWGHKLFMRAIDVVDWEPRLVDCRYHVHGACVECEGKEPDDDIWKVD